MITWNPRLTVLALLLCLSPHIAASASTNAPSLPAPNTDHDVKHFSKVIGWPKGKTPQAPAGFTVTRFADALKNPRSLYQAPNGDIFVAEAETEPSLVKKVGTAVAGGAKANNTGNSANRITMFRDKDGDGVFETREVYLEGLNQPFGTLVIGNFFYVGNTDALMRFPYDPAATKLTGKGEKIRDLPAGGYNNHWTRNLLATPDGKSLFVSVGSGTNHAEHGIENEIRRANILQVSADGKTEKIFASGLRNPVGMDLAPGSNTLWTSVNERDELGDDLVPDYITSVQEGGFYGWPYSYYGKNLDPRLKNQRPDLVAKAIVPDLAVGSHVAALGFSFYKGTAFPGKYRTGAFVAEHGSWNRSKFSGYKVVYVPMANGKPTGEIQDFLTGFIANEGKREVYGRPVSIIDLKDGSMLVTDDSANTIWQIKASASK